MYPLRDLLIVLTIVYIVNMPNVEYNLLLDHKVCLFLSLYISSSFWSQLLIVLSPNCFL